MTDPTPINVKTLQHETEDKIARHLFNEASLGSDESIDTSAVILGLLIRTLSVQEFAALKAAYGQEG